MEWNIEYIESGNYIKITPEGVFSITDHPKIFQKLLSAPFWKPGMNLFFDNRNFDFSQMNRDKLRMGSSYYQKVSEHLGNGKVALLMKTTLSYGFGRQFQLLLEDKVQTEIRVFTNEKEATDWLAGAPAFQKINN